MLDKKRVGITALKAFLGRLLTDHVTNEFPEIRKEIDDHYSQVDQRLKQLGPSRQSNQQQLQFLIKLAGCFQKNVDDSLTGRYFRPGKHPTKLRMHVQMANDAFSRRMHDQGHYYKFQQTSMSLDDISTAITDNTASENTASDGEKYAEGFEEEEDLDVGGSDQNIYSVIKTMYISSRGTELPGLVNPSVLEALFRTQTIRWGSIAKEYVWGVAEMIRKCNAALFVQLPADEGLKAKVLVRLQTAMDASFTAAVTDLNRILTDERTGPLMTNNHYFADNLAKARAKRVVGRLRKLGYAEGCQYTIEFEVLTNIAHSSNEAFAVHDLHDILKACYQVALKRFIDNVIVQVVERNLLRPGGPLTVFSPEWVGNLEPEELASIAGEDSITVNTRAELEAQLARLEQARKICSGRG